MKHRRSPTHGYQALAPRHPRQSATPTLLSPLTSISNIDDFQSNAWFNAPSYHTPLAGLGITCLPSPALQEHSALRMHVDALPARRTGTPPGHFFPSIVQQNALGSSEDRHTAQLASCLSHELTSHMELGLDSGIDQSTSDIIGLIPDVNMFDEFRRLDLPHPGINPLDTIRSTPTPDTAIDYEEPANVHNTDEVFSASEWRTEQSPSPRVIQDIMSILIQPAPEFPFLPWSSTNSPPAQRLSASQLAAPGSPASFKFDHSNVPDNERHTLPAPENTDPSPVLNAHLGIELSELVSRAERFRSKYPERDIDRTWLSHFAGKLSDRGELVNDFRCYVIGCDQRNKRRDHILVHVGAHIGQRPFACSVCPLRFLRKNECKRHEASHTGFRPYSCDICGQSFVRQDLVKRHVKRTHGVRDESQSCVARKSRKRARLGST